MPEFTPEQVIVAGFTGTIFNEGSASPGAGDRNRTRAARDALRSLKEAGFLVIPKQPTDAEVEAARHSLFGERVQDVSEPFDGAAELDRDRARAAFAALTAARKAASK